MKKNSNNTLTEEPHIVRDFMIGNTRIKIADNYCRDKTPEGVQEILKQIAINAQAALTAAAYAAQTTQN